MNFITPEPVPGSSGQTEQRFPVPGLISSQSLQCSVVIPLPQPHLAPATNAIPQVLNSLFQSSEAGYHPNILGSIPVFHQLIAGNAHSSLPAIVLVIQNSALALTN